jgi:hypothetical protein
MDDSGLSGPELPALIYMIDGGYCPYTFLGI